MKKAANCFSVIFMIYTLFVVVIAIVISINIKKYYDYDEHICNITRVDYPITMPVYGDVEGWSSCVCERNCRSLAPCINMYASIKLELKIKNDFMVEEKCTIHENKCINGEDPRWIAHALNNSIEIAESYINSCVPCYYNDNIDDIYLNKDFITSIITLAALMGFVWLCCCMAYISTLDLCNNDRFYKDSYIENKSYKV